MKVLPNRNDNYYYHGVATTLHERGRLVLARKPRPSSQKSFTSLYDAEDGKQYVVTSVPSVGILKSLGIMENTIIHKKMTYRLGGPVLLKVDSSEIAVGKEFAEKIIVRG